MRDVSPGPDDDDDPADDDATALTRDDPASRRRRADDSSANRDPAAAVDARLAGWLAKHSGRPAFRAARALAARVSADRRALASSSSSSSSAAAAAAAAGAAPSCELQAANAPVWPASASERAQASRTVNRLSFPLPPAASVAYSRHTDGDADSSA